MSEHLAIEIGNDYLLLSVLYKGNVINKHAFPISGRTPVEKKESLKESLESSGILSREFDEVTLAWSSRESTLVPSSVFGDTSASDVYRLCFGEVHDHNEIDYNRVSELSVVNIYQIGDWVKSFFVMRYPRINIQHTGSHLVRNMLNKDAFYLKGSVILFKDHFLLSIVKHNNLEFYSFFDYMNADDVIYHLSFALQQKEMNEEKGKIEIIPSAEADKELVSSIIENAGRLSNLDQLNFEVIEDYIAKSQLLCV